MVEEEYKGLYVKPSMFISCNSAMSPEKEQ